MPSLGKQKERYPLLLGLLSAGLSGALLQINFYMAGPAWPDTNRVGFFPTALFNSALLCPSLFIVFFYSFFFQVYFFSFFPGSFLAHFRAETILGEFGRRACL